MALLDDFKKFAFKGNVVDLAVGVIIGAAFGKIVTALVNDVIMPLVALVMPSGDWKTQGWILRAGATPKEDVVMKYGDFLGTILDFLIVAIVLFIVVSRIVERVIPKTVEVKDEKECTFCLEKVPGKATRCKFCTSELPAAAPAATSATASDTP
jgi:large conductance mechanosensitive channel